MTDRKNVVVVLGMHRGGTSLAMKALAAMGVRIGDNLTPPSEFNEEGAFEHAGIYAATREVNRILDRRVMSPQGVLPYPPEWWLREDVAEQVAEIANIVRAELSKDPGQLFGFKDPQSARMLPFWNELFERLELDPVYVLAIRNPAEVAESIHRRDKLDLDQAELLWLLHMVDAVTGVPREFGATISYDDWFNGAALNKRSLERLSSSLYGGAAGFPEEAVLSAPSSRLRHFAKEGSAATNPLCREFFRTLVDYHAGRISFRELQVEAQRIRDVIDAATVWIRGYEELQRKNEAVSDLVRQTRKLAQELKKYKDYRPLYDYQPAQELNVGDLEQRLTGTVHGLMRLGRVCLPLVDLPGTGKCGAFAAQHAALMEGILPMSSSVTLAVLRMDVHDDKDFFAWRDAMQEKGFDVVTVNEPDAVSIRNWRKEYVPAQGLLRMRPAAYAFDEWLKQRHGDFDTVLFSSRFSLAYYSLLARSCGLRYRNLQFVVQQFVPVMEWQLSNLEPVTSLHDLTHEYMERTCAAMADALVVSSPVLVRDLFRLGWSLDIDRVCLFEYGGSAVATAINAPSASCSIELGDDQRAIVFLGDLEPEKGLQEFCFALNRLCRKGEFRKRLEGAKVVFAGRETSPFRARDFISKQIGREKWPMPVEFVDAPDLNELTALANSGKALVFAASGSVDLEPAVIHLLQAAVPVVMTRSNPAKRFLQKSDALPVRHPEKIAPLISAYLSKGTLPDAPTMARAPQALALRAAPPNLPEPKWPEHVKPSVTVCVVHFNRPPILRLALESLRNQTYDNFNVVVVDDGSPSREVHEELLKIQEEVAGLGWKIAFQPNRYPGAARNHAARLADGEWLMFMDDDNLAKPEEIATFVEAARWSGADILTCYADAFFEGPPDRREPLLNHRITPTGNNVAMAFFQGAFGDNNSLVRKSAYDAIGGNTEMYGVGKEDQDFFTRAALAGFDIRLVPEALYWYREQEQRIRSRHVNMYAGHLRVFRNYRERVPPVLKDILTLAHGQHFAFEGARQGLTSLGRAAGKRRQSDRDYLKSLIDSRSWRYTRPLRAFARVVLRRPHQEITAEAAEVSRDPAALANAILASIYWEIAAPIRVCQRLAGFVRRVLAPRKY